MELSEQIESSLPPETSPAETETQIGENVFIYPLFWTTFLIFKREGCSATEAYKRSRPDLDVSDENFAKRASLLLKDKNFQRFVAKLESNAIGEVECWKRATMGRVMRWRDKIDKKSKDDLSSKDISLLTSSEKTLHEMGNKVLGIKDDSPVQVQVNMANVIASLSDHGKEVSESAIEDFTGEG